MYHLELSSTTERTTLGTDKVLGCAVEPHVKVETSSSRASKNFGTASDEDSIDVSDFDGICARIDHLNLDQKQMQHL